MKLNKCGWGGLVMALAVVGCSASATVKEPGCDVQSLSFSIPAVAATPNCATDPDIDLKSLGSVSTTTSIDLSHDLSKIGSVADNLSVAVTQLVVDNSNGDLSWVAAVDVFASTSVLPQAALATYVVPKGGTVGSALNASVVMDSATAYKYLSSGAVTLTVVLTGGTVSACQAEAIAMAGSVGSSINMCVDISGKFNKSL